MKKIKKILIDYLFVYIGLNLAVFVQALFLLIKEKVNPTGIVFGLPNEIYEGVAFHMIFSLVSALGFILLAYTLLFLLRTSFHSKIFIALAFISESLFYIFIGSAWYLWQLVLVYSAVILIYISIKKFLEVTSFPSKTGV